MGYRSRSGSVSEVLEHLPEKVREHRLGVNIKTVTVEPRRDVQNVAM
jgi:hypothetical protein